MPNKYTNCFICNGNKKDKSCICYKCINKNTRDNGTCVCDIKTKDRKSKIKYNKDNPGKHIYGYYTCNMYKEDWIKTLKYG